MIRSSGRRPFNNKTRSHGSRSRPRPTTTPCVCARVSARELISREPLCSLTGQTTHTGVSSVELVPRNTHTLRNNGPRTYGCENTYGLTTRQGTCRRKIITTREISKYTCAKCAKGEPYNAMIKHGGGARFAYVSIPSTAPCIKYFPSSLLSLCKNYNNDVSLAPS